MMLRYAALVLVLVACDAGERPPSHHGVKRATLFTPDTTEGRQMPLHGAVAYLSGMSGSSTVILDQDARTIRLIPHEYGKPSNETTRKLDLQDVERVMKLAHEAWHEDVTGEMPIVTDISEDLMVLDGDWAFHATGTMLSDDGRGLIAAGKTFDLMLKLAE